MAQLVNMIFMKPNEISLIPKTHMNVEEECDSKKSTLTSTQAPRALTHTYPSTPPHKMMIIKALKTRISEWMEVPVEN